MKKIVPLVIAGLIVGWAVDVNAQPSNLDLDIDGIGSVSAPLQLVQ